MIKYIHDFKMTPGCQTCWGDFWRGACYFRGVWYSVESCFYGYNKRDIARLLRQALRDKINRRAG